MPDQLHTRYCSKACASLDGKVRRRARIRGGRVEQYDRQAIYGRDGWTCRICGGALRTDVVYNHDLAPSIDHIIPVAAGGADAPDNVQAAHRICNSYKGADLIPA
jgi:5-methylcytosine-specific restriction endonuclease McrA